MFAAPLVTLVLTGLVSAAGADDVRNPEPLDTPLDHVVKLEGKQLYSPKPSAEVHFGFLVPAVREFYPELVSTDDSVRNVELIAPIVESIKTLYHRVLDSEERIKKLEALLALAQKDLESYRRETEVRFKALEDAHQ